MVNFNKIDADARRQMLIGNMEYEKENFILDAKRIQHIVEIMLKYDIDKMPFYLMEDLIDYVFTIKRAYDNYKEYDFDLKCLNKESEES